MGHIRLSLLPNTLAWQTVAGLVADGAPVAVVAAATAKACSTSLVRAAKDPNVVSALSLLSATCKAAETGDFANALSRIGLAVTSPPKPLRLIAAFSAASAEQGFIVGPSTDAGEMANLAAIKTITSALSSGGKSLLTIGPDLVQRRLRQAVEPGRHQRLLQEFFAEFMTRQLGFFLERELPLHVGPARRFLDTDEHEQFTAEFREHCFRISKSIKFLEVQEPDIMEEGSSDRSRSALESARDAIEKMQGALIAGGTSE